LQNEEAWLVAKLAKISVHANWVRGHRETSRLISGGVLLNSFFEKWSDLSGCKKKVIYPYSLVLSFKIKYFIKKL
jgi:hypothetical protein